MKKLMLSIVILFSTVFFGGAQEIGLQLYSIRNEVKTDLKGSLEKVRKMGIKELEGGELYGMDIISYKKMLDQMGYKMVSIGVGYKELDKDLTPVIQKAKTLGATYVVCFAIDHKGNEFGLKDVEEAAAKFNRAGKILKENGLNYELDVYWAKQGCADPVALLKKYPNRFLLMHLKDREHGTQCNDTGSADEETNVVLGKGDVNIKAIMKASKKSAVKHYFIEDESTRVMAQLPLSLQFLRSLR